MKKLSTLFLTPVVTLVLLNANAAVAAEKASETTPQNMTCREYLDMNPKEGANKQVISSQADSLIKISRIWADFFPANT
ncbi:HdeA/HdeB family chaperone, partial [Klebsiella pneumoniae]